MRFMRWPSALSVLRFFALLALLVSVADLVDYVRPTATFCSAGSGCDLIRQSGYGYLRGVPVPLLGALAFLALLAMSFSRTVAVRWVTGWLAAFGGAIGITLILTQLFVLDVICKLCMIIDTSALLAGLAGAVLSYSLSPHESEDVLPEPSVTRWAWGASVLLAMFGPPLWVHGKGEPQAPPSVHSLWDRSARIHAVDFVDFECPYCRQAYPRIEAALAPVRAQTQEVRVVVPLVFHHHAKDAAQAYLCAVRQGHGDAVADELFHSPDLTPEGCERAALKHGVELGAFRACLKDPSIAQQLAANQKLFSEAGLEGLPTVFFNDEQLTGLYDPGDYTSALTRAQRPRPSPLTRWWPFALVLALWSASMVRAFLPLRASLT